jgi:fumarate hydratase class I
MRKGFGGTLWIMLYAFLRFTHRSNNMAIINLHIPISEDAIRTLHVGDQLRLYGVVVTARDAAHKYLMENFIHAAAVPEGEQALHAELKRLWQGGVMYHCGPVVSRDGEGRWHFVSAGPTTSIREEPYEADVIRYFGLRGVIGKGGMGPKTLAACQQYGAVYLHAVGGAATLIADSVKEVLAVYKREEFGVPEALWVVQVEGFPAVITMDAHGQSLHEQVFEASRRRLAELM